MNCKKPLLRILANCNKNDLRTVAECNLKISELNSNHKKLKMKYFPLPENENWRVPLIKELLDVKAQNLSLTGCTNKEVEELIVHACTS